MQTDEEPETILDHLRAWRRELRGRKRLTRVERFLLELGRAYDELDGDYAELALVATEIEGQRDAALRQLHNLRARLRGLGGAA